MVAHASIISSCSDIRELPTKSTVTRHASNSPSVEYLRCVICCDLLLLLWPAQDGSEARCDLDFSLLKAHVCGLKSKGKDDDSDSDANSGPGTPLFAVCYTKDCAIHSGGRLCCRDRSRVGWTGLKVGRQFTSADCVAEGSLQRVLVLRPPGEGPCRRDICCFRRPGCVHDLAVPTDLNQSLVRQKTLLSPVCLIPLCCLASVRVTYCTVRGRA